MFQLVVISLLVIQFAQFVIGEDNTGHRYTDEHIGVPRIQNQPMCMPIGNVQPGVDESLVPKFTRALASYERSPFFDLIKFDEVSRDYFNLRTIKALLNGVSIGYGRWSELFEISRTFVDAGKAIPPNLQSSFKELYGHYHKAPGALSEKDNAWLEAFLKTFINNVSKKLEAVLKAIAAYKTRSDSSSLEELKTVCSNNDPKLSIDSIRLMVKNRGTIWQMFVKLVDNNTELWNRWKKFIVASAATMTNYKIACLNAQTPRPEKSRINDQIEELKTGLNDIIDNLIECDEHHTGNHD